ncbi:MAG: hypothetical protein ACD_79C01527G0008 [uncultured bacterium]|nr:MAG: hypothetical protein ACD_79C01527G0008 [uncultured bacterium]
MKRIAISIMLLTGIISFNFNVFSQEDFAAKVKASMKMLQDKTSELGEAKLVDEILSFGDTRINGDYDIVDEVADVNGGTATIFMAKDDGFIRVSTNVIKEGNRAIGTILDPKGPAIGPIQQGQAFYGKADILGSMYETGYEPIKDKEGKIIGILYVGYKLS